MVLPAPRRRARGVGTTAYQAGDGKGTWRGGGIHLSGSHNDWSLSKVSNCNDESLCWEGGTAGSRTATCSDRPGSANRGASNVNMVAAGVSEEKNIIRLFQLRGWG